MPVFNRQEQSNLLIRKMRDGNALPVRWDSPFRLRMLLGEHLPD